MSNNAIKAQLRELLPFLKDPNAQVRFGALQALALHAPEGSAGREIFFENPGSRGGLKPLKAGIIADLKVLCRDSPEIAHEAFKTLVNVSDSALISSSMADTAFLAFLVSYIANPSAVLADLASMLLANSTSFPIVAATLSSLTIPLLALPSSALTPESTTPYYPPLSRAGSAVPRNPYPEGSPVSVSALAVLVDAFVRAAEIRLPEQEDGDAENEEEEKKPKVTKGDPARKADLHFLASVFINVSGTTAGREFFVTPTPSVPLSKDGALEYPLSKLTAFTEHPSTIRRKGVAATIRNCAFNNAAHRIILAPDTVPIQASLSSKLSAPGVNALASILLPLAGPEEFDIDDMDAIPPLLQFLPPSKKRELDPSIRLTHIETLLLFSTTRKGREYLRENGVYAVIKMAHMVEADEQVTEAVVRLVNLLKRDESEETLGDGDEHWVIGGQGEESDSDDDQIVEILDDM